MIEDIKHMDPKLKERIDDITRPYDMPIPNFTNKEIQKLPSILDVIENIQKEENKFCNNGGYENQEMQQNIWNQVMTLPILENSDMVYCNNLPDRTFIVNRLNSRRFCLKPNLARHPYLYRGQKEHFKKLLSMFERYSDDELKDDDKRIAKNLESNLRVEEFISLLRTHPLFMLLEHGIKIDGLNDTLFLEMNYYGLAQHYNFSSCLLDFTSDIYAAAFFATTINSGNDVYKPYGGTEKNRVGVIYCHAIAPQASFKMHKFRSIGQQIYPRTGAQSGFVFEKDGYLMPVEKLVKPIFFKHDLACAERIFEILKKGEILFPKDDISPIANQILTSETISGSTFCENVYSNQDDFNTNLRMAESRNLKVDWNKRLLFTPDSLSEYYSDIKNGLWEQFCKPIHFACENGDVMKDSLLKIVNNPNYKQYFKPKYWERLMWCDHAMELRANRNRKKRTSNPQ